MNEIKINVPEGMEIDKENSTFECIRFKPKWTPKRGDFVAVGDVHPQLFIVDTVIRMTNTTFTFHPIVSYVGDEIRFNERGCLCYSATRKATDDEREWMIENIVKAGGIYDPCDARIAWKRTFPATWEEFRKNNPIKPNDYFVSTNSKIAKGDFLRASQERMEDVDDNLLPSKEYAEAMLALCKLIQLRDCYNNGWKPDWDNAIQHKYCINVVSNSLTSTERQATQCTLAFEYAHIRDMFLTNFRDLLEVAKPLL